MIEIRWHGRGGQGAKTAALLFADAALHTGKYIQAFPEYGPERMGAPVAAFNRLSDRPITLHCGIKSPDIVVVLDPTLCRVVNVTEGLRDTGKLLVNTEDAPEDTAKKIGFSGKVYTVSASKIALYTIKRDIPNTPMLGALVKVSGLMSLESLLSHTEEKLSKKFSHRPEVIKGNIEAIRMAYCEVRE
jgi:pyruvate ferredoxin oxidoreductase gamma subunit